MKTELSYSLLTHAVSIVSFWYFTMNGINLGQQLLVLDLLCCADWFQSKKKNHSDLLRDFTVPTSCLPMSVRKVSCPSRTILTNEAKLIQRHPGCTNWAVDPFHPSSFQEQVLVRKYFEIFPVHWIFCFDKVLMQYWICIYALLKMKIFQWFGAYKVWAAS